VLNLSGLGLTTPILNIELIRQVNLTYTLLRGALPSGLSLMSNGVVSGTVGVVPGIGTIPFEFTVRCSDGTLVQDRTFTVNIAAVQTPWTWTLSAFPPQQTDGTLNIDYIPLGTFDLAETLTFPLSWTNQDGSAAVIEVLPTGVTGAFIEGLPGGVSIAGYNLQGTIDPNITPGRYLFKLGFQGQTINTIICEMIVNDTLAVTVTQPDALIEWVTPPGSLGSINETYTSHFFVAADAGGEAITYSLTTESGLPPGISLFEDGHLLGYFAHVDQDTTFTFTVVATCADATISGVFSLTVFNLFNTADILEVRLGLRSTDRAGMTARYNQLIAPSSLYRVIDPNFGIPESPYVYLIKGLQGTDLSQLGDEVPYDPFTPNYYSEFPVLLGQHQKGIACDQNGNPLYEVIYRDVIDPQAQAGGFSWTSNTVLQQNVVAAVTGLDVYPKSFRNARYDMTQTLGFASANATVQQTPGLQGVEALPLWMMSPQAQGNAATVPGFVPGMVVAFVNPGQADQYLSTLDADSQLPSPGHNVVLDRYFAYDFMVKVQTVFDDDETTFDDGLTLFDAGG
jgi:hypothetical protein